MIDPLAVIRTLHFAASLSLAGALLFALVVARRGGRGWLVWGSLALAVLTGAAWLLLFAASLADEATAFSKTLHLLLAETRFGHVWILRFIALALCAVSLVKTRYTPALGAAIVALALIAVPGHSGATPGALGWIYLGNDMLHLIAAGAWVGGLLPLAFYLRRASVADARAAAWRFSLLGIISVGILLASGLVNTWNLVGTIEALRTTIYGQLVLLKIVLFGFMVALATTNRYRLTPRISSRTARRALWQNTITEAGLGALVLFAVGILGTTPPGAHVHLHDFSEPPSEDAAFVHIHGARAMTDMTIAPGRAGVVQIRIRLMREDLSPLPARRVALVLEHQQRREPIVLPARLAEPGEWKAGPIALPVAGIWIAKVEVTFQDGAKELLDAPIVAEFARPRQSSD